MAFLSAFVIKELKFLENSVILRKVLFLESHRKFLKVGEPAMTTNTVELQSKDGTLQKPRGEVVLGSFFWFLKNYSFFVTL